MAKKSSSGEMLINHYALVRLRLNGSGNMKMRLFSLDEVRLDVLADLPMLNATDTEPERLANFTQQRAKLETRTTEIDEVFSISKIIVYAKPTAKSYPG